MHGLLTNKDKNSGKKKFDSAPPWPPENFESYSADMCAKKISASVDGGPSGGSRVRRPGSEDPIGASGIDL